MRSLAFAAALCAATTLMTPAMAEDPSPMISMTGTASVSAAPDLAIVSAGVESQGETARAALDANNTAMAAVLEAVKTLGVEDKDVQTSNFNVGPNWEHGPNGSRQNGFTVSNQVTVRLRDASQLGAALDALVTAGANRAGNVSFEVSEPESLLDDARKRAVAQARARAELYAAAAGAALGEVLDIREGDVMQAPRPMYARAQGAMAAPVAMGENELSVSVSITWALKQ